MDYVIAGDLGGTKTAWVAFELTKDKTLGRMIGEPFALVDTEYKSFSSLAADADGNFPKGVNFKKAAAISIGAAGVWDAKDQVVKLPHYWEGEANIGEFIRSQKIDPKHVRILNDFESEVRCIATEVVADAVVLQKSQSVPDATSSILIGPGTGLGVAALTKENTVIRSEGGNIPIGFPISSTFRAIWPYMINFWNEEGITCPRFEDILSGNGLANLHFVLTGHRLETPEISGLIKKNKADETRDFFAEILGLACQSAAYFFWLPKTIYLTGGVLKKTPELATSQAFLKAFNAATAHQDEIHTIGVSLIKNPFTALYGAGAAAAVVAQKLH